ncbi:hypothetical protein CHS0354_037024 [Potamilus streckersoni]|uniref:Uncharacterized protein n=1 Tax=Potamilus streckersoni TaxID=2493646 RepID=A0AAE0SKN0_9BIVA|nr:hypothetical protein CHS0354_037024 [Potamilus streckersoni]
MLLVLSSVWLSKKKSKSNKGLYSLNVLKAIAFGVAGQTVLETYAPPRRVTYFMNLFTNANTPGQMVAGKDIEDNLDCPTSSSVNLRRLTDNILWTHHLMSKVGLTFPETVGFVFDTDMAFSNDISGIRVVHVDNKKTNLENVVSAEVRIFLESCLQTEVTMIVVKTSGNMWRDNRSLTFHSCNDFEEITNNVLRLLAVINKGDAVLMETFIETIKPDKVAKVSRWSCAKDCAIRMRSIVSCGISLVRVHVKEDDTICQPLNVTLNGYGLFDESEIERFEKDVREKSTHVLDSIMSYESELSTSERGGLFAETDVIGIDFMITRRNSSVLTPVVIAVDSHNCIYRKMPDFRELVSKDERRVSWVSCRYHDHKISEIRYGRKENTCGRIRWLQQTVYLDSSTRNGNTGK